MIISISEPEQPDTWYNKAILQLAFRSFFLLGALSSVVALSAWVLTLNGIVIIEQGGLSALVWHTHEMIFAFAATVAVGFILTAVQTWTGVASVKGKTLALLISLWLVIRGAIYINSDVSIYLALVCSGLWWALVIFHYSRIVFTANNQRNYLFIPVLAVIAVLNLTILLADMFEATALALHLAKTAVFMFCLLMTIIGGRVIPFFTHRGANTDPIESLPLVEKLVVPCTALCALGYALSIVIDTSLPLVILLSFTGLLQVLRLSRWHSSKTISVPLLWSLHLSYLFMAFGLLLMAVSLVSGAVTSSVAIHLITVGAMGLMILAMMSRVSLGHTGRPLQVHPLITLAFALMAGATLARVLLPMFAEYLLGWNLSALLWVLAFALFVGIYGPILFAKRLDNRPG